MNFSTRLNSVFSAVVAALAAASYSIDEPVRAQVSAPSSQLVRQAPIAALNGYGTLKSYNKLTKTLAKMPAKHRLGWLRARMFEGRSVIISINYLSTLWAVSKNLNATSSVNANVLKDTAGAIAIYALLVARIDGLKCEDLSAPGSRRQQLLRNYRAASTYTLRLCH